MSFPIVAPLDHLKQRDLVRRPGAWHALGFARRRLMESLEPRRLFAAGDLYGDFGVGGRVSTDLGADTKPRDVAVQTDGKVVVAGHARSPSGRTSDAILVRYNVDGSIDSSFGTGGVARVDFGGNELFVGLAVLGDGKLVAGGRQLDGKWMLARFKPDGTLDANSGFGGTDGIEIGDGAITALALQGDKILAGSGNTVRRHVASTGALDTTFGAGGAGAVVINDALISGLSNFRFFNDLDVQADGKILVLGTSTGDQSEEGNNAANAVIGIARLTANGAADDSFGAGGGVRLSLDIEITFGSALAVRAGDGRIAVVGSDGSQSPDLSIWNADGSYVGTVSAPPALQGDLHWLSDVMFDSSGRIIVTGTAEAYNQHLQDNVDSFYAARFTLDPGASPALPQRDPTFDGNGFLGGGFTAFGFENPDSYSNGAASAAMTLDGRIVIAGWGDIGDETSRYVLQVAQLENGVIEPAPAVPQLAIEGGVLNVRGTNGNDAFFVRRSGADNVSIEVRYGNNQSTTATFDMDDFTGVTLRGFGGADAFNMIDAIVSPLVRNTTIAGGDGNDTISYATRSAALAFRIDPTDSTMTSGGQVDHFTEVETVVGGAGDDTFRYGNFVEPQDEDRHVFRLQGRGGNDAFTDSIGLSHNFSTTSLMGGDGDDSFDDDLYGFDVAYGEAGNDYFYENEAYRGIIGGDGSDTVEFGGEQDVLDMRTTPDVENLIISSSLVREAIGNAGGNRIDAANSEGVTLRGLGGNDTLLGGDGDDLLEGGDGDDTLDGGLGADRMLGGAGRDTIDYSSRTNRLIVGLDDFQDDGEAGENDYASPDVERLIGGSGNDRLGGSAGDNVLYGGDGNDTMSGGGGRDALFGEAGNDKLDGGDGNDYFEGGAGSDTLGGGAGNDELLGLAGDDRLDGGLGADVMRGGAGRDTIDYSSRTNRLIVGLDTFQDDGEVGENDLAAADIERLIGGSGNDRLGGGDAENVLFGGPGNDTLGGGGGRDALFGEAGNDKLDGGDGDDYLEGGAGHDALHGGGGSDTLLGLAGNDRLFSDGDGLKDNVIGGTGTDSADVDELDEVSGVEITT